MELKLELVCENTFVTTLMGEPNQHLGRRSAC